MKSGKKMNWAEAVARARVMKALGHPVRLMVVDTLQHGDASPCELQSLFKICQSALSRHLTVLRQAGLLTERRAGFRTILHLDSPGIGSALDCAQDVVAVDLRRRSRAGGLA